ncbi:MAG: LuxR family transcriptional regulator [Burkholderiales bacterium]|nr:LuxR family transcriptional regulator [Burkholderiales bacterium]
MLHRVAPGPPNVGEHAYVPPLLAPLVAAAARGGALDAPLAAIAGHFGFDHFSYAASAMPEIDHQHAVYVWTTLPRAWVERYDRQAYVDVDPRVRATWPSAVPLVWDQATLRGSAPRENAFLDDALAHGIGSGIAYMFHAAHDWHVFVGLDSRVGHNDPLRLAAIGRNVADIVAFSHYFHEIFMRQTLDGTSRPPLRASPLSRRETECVRLAARGMTTDDIALKLDIGARTVQFHFDRIRSKLGAANRQEVVAIAVQRNFL